MKKYLPLLLFITSLFCAVSCVNTRQAVYFNNIGDTLIQNAVVNAEPVIQRSDLLSIHVSSLSPEASQVFNTNNMPAAISSASIATALPSVGYLVGSDGDIQFPVLGKIHAAGLTKKQLNQDITKALIDKKLLIDPIVNISFLNYRVTVLGEVGRPAVITVANEKISLLEALGLAGDLTIYAKRDNVLLIREENGQKILKRINLNTNEIFTSPYYFLKTNDIVYVEPNRARIATTSRSQTLLPIVFSALSFATIIAQYVIR